MSTVLITGASGGIGYELAKLFARDRHNLVLVARSAEKLGQVATELRVRGVTVKTIALDLSAPAELYELLPNSLRNFYNFDDGIWKGSERSVEKTQLTLERT